MSVRCVPLGRRLWVWDVHWTGYSDLVSAPSAQRGQAGLEYRGVAQSGVACVTRNT